MLLAYSVTSNDAYMQRFMKSLAQQKALDKISRGRAASLSALITNAEPERLPREIAEYFGSRIYQVDPYVRDETTGQRYFCLSKMRNESLRLANAFGVNWLMLCDADTVVADIEPEGMPKTGFGSAKVYMQKSSDETIEHSLGVVNSRNPETISPNNSWFVLGKNVFNAMRFDERYFGYGFEDTDFRMRTQASGFKHSDCQVHVIHAFHTEEAKNIDKYRWRANSDLFEVSKRIAGMKADVRHPHEFATIYTEHPEWRARLLLVPDIGRIAHLEKGPTGSYRISGDTIIVDWDGFGREIFQTAPVICARFVRKG